MLNFELTKKCITLRIRDNNKSQQLRSMRMTGKKKSMGNNVFHIRLGPHVEKVDLKDQAFLRILQQQYATKYLEGMGVEATFKNIAKILRQHPLESCEIVESRLTGGLHTDTITIITKNEAPSHDKQAENQTVSNQMLKLLDLKKMALKKDSKTFEKRTAIKNSVAKNQQSNTTQGIAYLDFSIKAIKSRYIFPFNQNFSRKNRGKLKDQANLLQLEREDSKLIFQAAIFKFPFTQIKLSLNTLKELQSPIQTKLADILNFLERFYQQFPKSIFPVQSAQTKKGLKKQIHICFDKKAIDRMYELIRSEQNAKFIGVFLHLSYWAVFGAVNPIQVEASIRRKMFLMISETMEYFQLKTENRKNWKTLTQPMLILTLKMALDYFYHQQYPKLFLAEESLRIEANDYAFDKLLLFVDKLLDQGSINGRFIFLESDIDGPKGNFTKDKKFIRKRIFGTSPALQLILPEPKDGKARSIMAKNFQIDQKEGILEENCHNTSTEQDRECREKLLNLALLKIRNRIEEFSGSQSINPIIKLEQKEQI